MEICTPQGRKGQAVPCAALGFILKSVRTVLITFIKQTPKNGIILCSGVVKTRKERFSAGRVSLIILVLAGHLRPIHYANTLRAGFTELGEEDELPF